MNDHVADSAEGGCDKLDGGGWVATAVGGRQWRRWGGFKDGGDGVEG